MTIDAMKTALDALLFAWWNDEDREDEYYMDAIIDLGYAIKTLEEPRKPLTEQEIRALPEWFPSHETAAVLPLIRAVEKAHGIS